MWGLEYRLIRFFIIRFYFGVLVRSCAKFVNHFQFKSMNDQGFRRYDRYLKEIIQSRMNNDEAKKYIKTKLSRKIIISYDIQIYYVLKNIVKNMNSSRVVLINDPHFQIEFRIICIMHEQRLINDKQKDKLIEIMKKTPINEHIDTRESQIISQQTQFLHKQLAEYKIQDSTVFDKTLASFNNFLNQIDFSEFGLDEKLSLIGYGSYVNGFGLKGSDIDSMICTTSFFNERTLLSHIYSNFKKIEDTDNFGLNCQQFLLKDNLRVPILTFLHLETQISLDVCVNNCLGVINSNLLKVYSSADPRCEQIGKLVKIWAKKKGVAHQFNFSSYAIVLMVIYFFQKKKILPVLQKISTKDSYIKIKKTVKHSQLEEFEAKVDFQTNMAIIKEHIEYNNEPIDLLLKQFFEFYSQNGEFLSSQLKCDIKGDNQKVSHEDQDYLFSIVDPFEQNHNLGDRVKKNKSAEILKHFDQAVAALTNNDMEELFRDVPMIQNTFSGRMIDKNTQHIFNQDNVALQDKNAFNQVNYLDKINKN